MFRVGQKVVCVDASPAAVDTQYSLTLDAVYTVRGITPEGRDAGVYLVEVPDGSFFPGSSCRRGWRAARFRPIVSRPTSIEFAHEILRKVNAPALPSTRTSEVLG
jgi:hypothetical protein